MLKFKSIGSSLRGIFRQTYRVGFVGLLALGLLSRPVLSEEKPLASGTHSFKLEAAGQTWTYVLHLPPTTGAGSEKVLPLVVLLHGAGGNGKDYLKKNGWSEKADKAGFVVVAPDGLPAQLTEAPHFLLNPRLWNSGQLKERSPRAKIDDVAFFRVLLKDVAARTSIDASRRYCVGHSNGASMTFKLASDLNTEFAAVATLASHCFCEPKMTRPIPTLYIIGMLDPLIPLAGGERTLPWGKSTVPPVKNTLDKWAKALGCSPEPKVIRDSGGVTISVYKPADAQARLQVVYIEGQGHGWPGGKESGLPKKIIGPSVSTYDATSEIWDFFHSYSSAADGTSKKSN